MRKFLTLILGLLMTQWALAATQNVQVEGIWYSIDTDSKTATVIDPPTYKFSSEESSYPDLKGALVIKQTFNYENNDYTVTGVDAFSYCSDLTSVTFPESVKNIGGILYNSHAFYYCAGLTSVTFSDGVESIKGFGGCAGLTSLTFPDGVQKIDGFYRCSELKSVDFPESVQNIDGFGGCTGLTSVTFPESVQNISGFGGCTGLTSVTFPENVQRISGFTGCTGLISVTFPKGLQQIESESFWDCPELTSVVFPESMSSGLLLGQMVFSNCTGLKYINLPEGIYQMGGFNGCTGLTSVTFPKSVKEIVYGAFGDCTGLTSVTFPEGIQKIGGFSGCTGLTSVTFPEGVQYINQNSFDGCTGLTSLTFPEGITWIEGFGGCTGLKSLTFPDGVRQIGSGNSDEETFSDLPGLTSVTFPESLKSLYGFKKCDNLTLISCFASEPPESYWPYPFSSENFSKATLRVHANAIDAYKSSETWKNFENIQILLEDYKGGFEIEDFEINANESKDIEVNLDVILYDDSYTGLQFDIEMPNDISLESYTLCSELQEAGYKLSAKTTNENTTRFVIYPSTDLSGVKILGNILTLKVKAASDITPGLAAINITNSMISTTEAEDIYLEDSSAQVTVNTTITKITLTPAVQNIEVWDYCTFTAIIEPADSKNTNLIWSCSDPSKVSITGSGLEVTVRGTQLGTVTITATSPFDDTVKGEATLNIVGKISIEGAKHHIKETEELQLTSKFSPAGADSPVIVWSSSDPQTATVDAASGLVTGVKAGQVTITASARDYEGISADFQIEVEPRIPGDANDNGYVNVSDVVAIANYIVDYTVRNFCFVNADADNSKEVTSNDITTTVNIILDDDDYSVGPRSVRANALSSKDILNASNFEAATGKQLNIGVKLENSMDYVALQASIRVPNGMTVEKIIAGERASSHSLLFNVKEDNTVKLVFFSLDNTPFGGGDAPLFTIVAQASEECGDIEIVNILASDKDSNEYSLGFSGGLNENFTTGLDNVEMESGEVRYFTIDGVEIRNPQPGQLVIRTCGNKVEKIIIK